MKLADSTWPDVEAFDRDAVVLIPTGSLEQHGRHLPLFTDSLIVTAVAEAVEARLPDRILLTPTLWLGASGHHLAFAGSLSASFEAYMATLESVIRSLQPKGFHKFFVLNGHGGNTEPNGIVIREMKRQFPDLTFGHSSYYEYVAGSVKEILEGPMKTMAHACEAEASLVMHLRPDLVRTDRLRDDGLVSDPAIRGLCHSFDEMTEDGSFGYATFATAEKGKRIFEAAVEEIVKQMGQLAEGYVLTGPASRE
jgi:creatinine amidohydrolase